MRSPEVEELYKISDELRDMAISISTRIIPRSVELDQDNMVRVYGIKHLSSAISSLFEAAHFIEREAAGWTSDRAPTTRPPLPTSP